MKKKTVPCLVSLFALLLCLASVVTAEDKAATFEVEVRKNVRIPMRDGVELSANISLPRAEGG